MTPELLSESVRHFEQGGFFVALEFGDTIHNSRIVRFDFSL